MMVDFNHGHFDDDSCDNVDWADAEEDDTAFWDNLDDHCADASCHKLTPGSITQALAQFNLFEHTDDEQGLCDETLDCIDLVEQDLVENNGECCTAILHASMQLGDCARWDRFT